MTSALHSTDSRWVCAQTTAQEVAEAVLCASSIGLAVSARSGGHSYAAYGLGGENGSLVIDMSAFDTVSVEPESGVATIGAGNRLGEIILGLTSAGRAMVSSAVFTVSAES